MPLSELQLRAIMPAARPDAIVAWIGPLRDAMAANAIDATAPRMAGWRAMLFPVYVLSPVLLATFVFLPWLTVVVLILSVQAGYLAGAVAHSAWERWSRPPPRQPPP